MRRSPEEQLMLDATGLFNERMPHVDAIFSNLTQPLVGVQTSRFYKVVDDLIGQSPNRIDCKVGCSYCCHYRVMVTPIEIFTIFEHIGRMAEAEKGELENSVREYVKRVKDITPYQHEHTNIPCSFLKKQQCSIYQIRPLACRGHHSIDANVCRRTFENVNSDESGPLDYQRKAASTAMDNALLAIQHKAGMEVSKYELHAALLEALTNNDSVKKWRNGKTAFPSVRDKSTLDKITGGWT